MNQREQNVVNDKIQNGFEFSISEIFNEAANLFKGTAGFGIIGTIIYVLGSVLSNLLLSLVLGIHSSQIDVTNVDNSNDVVNAVLETYSTTYGSVNGLIYIISSTIISYSLYIIYAGIFRIQYTYEKGQMEFSDIFYYFKPAFFIKLFLFFLLTYLILIVSYSLCILPGIYLQVAWTISLPLILFANADLMESLEASRKIISKNWLNTFVFSLSIIGVNVLGLFACGFGILVTIPFSITLIYVFYKKIMGTDDDNQIDKIGQEPSHI